MSEASLPVAVVPFGWERTAREIEGLGCRALRRLCADGTAVVSDDGLYLLDCRFPPIADPEQLAGSLKRIVGVVEHGLFLHMTARAIVAGVERVQVLAPAER